MDLMRKRPADRILIVSHYILQHCTIWTVVKAVKVMTVQSEPENSTDGLKLYVE